MQPNVLQLPVWMTADEAQSHIPTNAWALISYPDSLTGHLRQLTNNNVIFRLLFANWGHADPIERQALNLASEERTWIRCIEHRYENKLWVYGRTIFPEATIKATRKIFSGLGVQSLGDVIFQDPSLKREPFSYALLSQNNIYYPSLASVVDKKENVWARRSILYFQEQPILINEIFMPESYAQPNN